MDTRRYDQMSGQRFSVQLRILLDKNLKLRRRNPASSAIELLMPLVIMYSILFAPASLKGLLFQKTIIVPHIPPFDLNSCEESYTFLFTSKASASNITHQIIRQIELACPHTDRSKLKYFDHESDLLNWFLSNHYGADDIVAAVLFDEFSLESSQIDYRMRLSLPEPRAQSSANLKNTSEITKLRPLYGLFKSDKSSARYGHILGTKSNIALCKIKGLVDRAIIDVLPSGIHQTHLYSETLPMKSISAKPSYHMGIFVLVMLGSFGLGYSMFVKRLVAERASHFRETLRLIGLSDIVYWLAGFLDYFFLLSVQFLIILIGCFLNINPNGPVFKHSNFGLIYLGLLLYSAAAALSGCWFSIVFKHPKLTSFMSLFFFYFTLGLNIDLDHQNLNFFHELKHLLPNTCGYGLFCVALHWEESKIGLNLGNIFKDSATIPHAFGFYLLSLMTTCMISCILIWYLEAVWLWQAGVPKPLYFFLLPSYWLPPVLISRRLRSVRNSSTSDPALFEASGSNVSVGISVCNLTKRYGTLGFNSKLAVSKLNMECCFDEITVLLGHNGAGKTTVMNIISGLVVPTQGTVYVNGYDIQTQTRLARANMSLCSQEDTVIPELTVNEHLHMVAGIKGIQDMESNINRILESLAMIDSVHKRSRELSGGQKRRLCLAMALIGDPKILVLDEPTSGLDPNTKREIWDALITAKRGRTILLSTHSMEEADALADRVGIMYAGSIRCYGSAMFLKRALGTGYQIRIAKAKDILCDSVNMPIRQYFPNAVLLENMDAEVHYAPNSKNEERFAKRRSKSSHSEFESRRLMSIDSSMNLSDSSLFSTSLFHQSGLNN